jgi:hypothetical protein
VFFTGVTTPALDVTPSAVLIVFFCTVSVIAVWPGFGTYRQRLRTVIGIGITNPSTGKTGELPPLMRPTVWRPPP